jgi:hypothetical protein
MSKLFALPQRIKSSNIYICSASAFIYWLVISLLEVVLLEAWQDGWHGREQICPAVGLTSSTVLGCTFDALSPTLCGMTGSPHNARGLAVSAAISLDESVNPM